MDWFALALYQYTGCFALAQNPYRQETNVHFVLSQPLNPNLGEPTHKLVPCWMPSPLPSRNECMDWCAQPKPMYELFRPSPKPLPPRNQCTGCFIPTPKP